MNINLGEIFGKFSPKQRFLVLLAILIFVSGTWILTEYVKTAKCGECAEQLAKTTATLVQVSEILRKMTPVEEELVAAAPVDSAASIGVDRALPGSIADSVVMSYPIAQAPEFMEDSKVNNMLHLRDSALMLIQEQNK